MVDLKVYKPVSATFAATAASAGAFPAPVGVGAPVSLTASTVGVMFTTFASSDGTVVLSVIADNAAAPATPVGSMIEGVYVTPLPTYASGDAAVMHMDSRGRVIVSISNPGTGASIDVDTDDSAAPANPTGIWVMSLYDATLPTYTTGDAAALHASINGELLTLERPPGTSAVTSVAAAVVNTSLLAADTTRRGAMIFNDSASANLYVKLGSTASLTSFTALVPPSGYYELPYPVYTGAIDGIWDAAVGDARITELTV
jgi:hypothetical protein